MGNRCAIPNQDDGVDAGHAIPNQDDGVDAGHARSAAAQLFGGKSSNDMVQLLEPGPPKAPPTPAGPAVPVIPSPAVHVWENRTFEWKGGNSPCALAKLLC